MTFAPFKTPRLKLAALLVVALTALSSGLALAQTAAQPVSFTSDDGVALSGLWYGEGRDVVILSHQYDLDQAAWADLAATLAADGYGVLTYNFRGYPPSGGKQDIGAIGHDLDAAIAFAKTKGATHIVLGGASMGGIATVPAAIAAAPDAYVILSAPLGFAGLVADDASLSASTAKKLFINTESDNYAADTKHMFEVAAEPKSLEFYPGGQHGLSMLKGNHAAEIKARIVAFIEEAAPVQH